MGFSLAQVSLNLVMPAHAADVYAKPVALFAFLATFAIVASTWYSHHWLFEYLFVPNPLTIFANFVTLASLVWLVYQFQLYLHFTPTPDDQFAAMSYVITFGVTWLLLGLLYGTCLRLRWNAMDVAVRKSALFKTGRLLTIGVTTVAATAAEWMLHKTVLIAFVAISVAAAIYRIVARIALRSVPA